MPDPTPGEQMPGAQNHPPAGNQQQQQQPQPPANNPSTGNNQNQQQSQQQQLQGQFILSQEQFNQRWAEKMVALEKDLGMPFKDVKALVEGSKKPKTPPTGSQEKLTGADLKIAKMEALMNAGVPSQKIPKLLKRITGSTREEIEADILEMKADGFLTSETPAAQPQQQQQNQTPNAAQGAGNPGVQNNQQQKKIWKEAEIAELRKNGQYAAHRDEILQALKEGRVE